MSTITLFCLVQGTSTPFPIDVNDNLTVGHLKDAIKAKNSPEFDIWPAHRLRLWEWNKESDEQVNDLDLDEKIVLDPKKKLNQVFVGGQPNENYTHIIVKTPAPPTTRTSTLMKQKTLGVHDRQKLLEQLFTQLMENGVIHFRATPASGKTTLARLFFDYIVENEPGYRSVYHSWVGQAASVSSLQANIPGTIWSTPNLIIIIDEAQESYEDEAFWVDYIKFQAGATPSSPYFLLFSSFGSPESTVVRPKNSTPIKLRVSQRVSLRLGSPDANSVLRLCFDEQELKELVERFSQDYWEGLTIEQEVVNQIWLISYGHPGVVGAILSGLSQEPSFKTIFRSTRCLYLNAVAGFLCQKDWVLKTTYNRIMRSFPGEEDLQNTANADVVQVLKKGVSYPIIARDVDEPCVEEAYRRGWLQSEIVYGTQKAYFFPSPIHLGYIERRFMAEPFPTNFPFLSLWDFCLAAIKQFSPIALRLRQQTFTLGSGISGPQQNPEAQYQDELYRACSALLGGRVVLSSEYSEMTAGRVDFFIRERRWAIECIRDRNQVEEHLGRFKIGGTYWGLSIHDRVIIDFRTKSKPIKRRDDPKFHTVVFDENYMFCRVYDYHCTLSEEFQLVESLNI